MGLLCGILLGLGAARSASSEPLLLVPGPREMRNLAGAARLTSTWNIVAPSDSDDRYAATLLSDEVAACYGWRWRVAPGRASDRTIELRAAISDPKAPRLFNQQGYRLTILPRRITIEASSSQGRCYGVQTLRQILRNSPSGVLPCVAIKDYPALEWRGISDDISRGQISTLPDFKHIVRQLGYYKMNLYQPYIEDVFAFTVDGRPVGRPGALTGAELAEIVADGKREHVTVCPVFETLAHQDQLLERDELVGARARPEKDAVRSSASGLLAGAQRLLRRITDLLVIPQSADHQRSGAFSTTDPRALEMARSLVDQIAGAAPGPFFHIGGDEWADDAELGTGPAARLEAARRYGAYVGALGQHLWQRFGRRTMVYADVVLRYPELARTLPKDLVLVDWHYDPADSFLSVDTLHAAGFRSVLVSPALWTWKTFYPNYARAFKNVAGFADAGKRAGAIGCVTAAWGDGGAENLRENNWTGYAFASAASWEPLAPPVEGFLQRFVVTQYGGGSRELAEAEKLLGWQEFEGVGWAGRLYHRPPLVRRRPEPWVERMRKLRADMLQVQRDLLQARLVVRFERDHLDALELCASRFRFIAERELFLDGAARMLEGQSASLPAVEPRAWLVGELSRLTARSSALEKQFGPLWLRRNRPEGLEENLSRMRRQPMMLERLQRRAREGRLSVDSTYSHMQALSTGS